MKIDYSRPEYYYNRELSWVAFDHRVLGEARDKSLPLFERLKFLSITASNLDEFFMVRVASLKDMVNAGYKKKDIAGMTAQEQLEAVNKATHELVNMQYSTYNRSLIPLLGQNGLQVIEKHEELEEEDKKFVDRYTGIDISDEQILNTLSALGFAPTLENEVFTAHVPSWRATKDVTIKADSLEELVTLKTIANALQHRVSSNYRFVLSFNSTLIALGALGILQPAASAMLHNLSTIGISLRSMTNLIQKPSSAPQLED